MLVADEADLDALDQLAAIDAPRPGTRGRAERAAVDHHRRGQPLIAAGQAPIEGQKRCPSRRHSPRRVQRANALCSVVKGTPERQPAIRHCIPPKVSIQINPIRRRRKLRSVLRPRWCTPIRSQSMVSSSASTAKMNTSTSANTFQPSPRLGRGTARAAGGGRSAEFKRLACDIGPIWCGGADALSYVSEPT